MNPEKNGKKNQKKVTVIGPINADILAIGSFQGDWQHSFDWEAEANIAFCVAGSSGYTLQGFNKLGNKTRIFSTVGDDSFGIAINADLEKQGIDTSNLLLKKEAHTAIGIYWLMYGNKKRPLAYQMSTFTPWPQSWTEETEKTLLDTDLLHCGGYLHYPDMFFGKTADLFCHAKNRGVITSIDTQFPLLPGKTKFPWLLNMTDILPFVDVLIMDEHEARSFAGTEEIGDAVKSIQQYKTKIIIVKFGNLGSRVYTPEMVLMQPAFTIAEPVDSIGAGDAYGSAFMTYYIQNKSIEECARFASIVASFTITKAGGVQGFPTTSEAEKYIDQQNIPFGEKQEWPKN